MIFVTNGQVMHACSFLIISIAVVSKERFVFVGWRKFRYAGGSEKMENVGGDVGGESG